jgi:UDP-N-acetylmuramoylalanine--D-glutamate ligase
MDLAGKTVVVVGLGKSGLAAARRCLERGARVVATDQAPAERLAPAIFELNCELVTGGHSGVPFAESDLVVVSPGVAAFAELERAERAGVEVIGELELGWRLLGGSAGPPLAAVGGTNGKSSVTTLLAGLLGDRQRFVGGNLGTPLSDAVGGSFHVLIVEVSSFQLERAPTFKPQVSVLLNVTEDHLDRYPSFVDYARAKGNAFVNQTPDDYAIVPAGDAACREQAQRGRGRLVTFGEGGDYFVSQGGIVERASERHFSLHGVELLGRHNQNNAAAAIAAARALGAFEKWIENGLAAFRPLPHRMSFAGSVGGVRFYDDSKATNVGAAVTALLGITEPRCVLIAGGRDKLGSYAPLVAALAQKGRGIVVIGEAADRIADGVGSQLPVQRATNMEQAVERAFSLAEPGDAVLLSPACSSFDMFTSYAERGDRFVDAVLRLARQTGQQVIR